MNHLPNILTVLRIVLTLFFVAVISQEGLAPIVGAAVIFWAASLTDFLDGYLAKKNNLVSSFGKIMDPIADKFLILAAFFVFMRMHLVAAWMFVLIALREILVTASRLIAIRQGRVLEAEKAGKYKTVAQIVVISVMLLFSILRETVYGQNLNFDMLMNWQMVIHFLMLVTVALTLFSGFSYLKGYRKVHYV